MRALLLCCLVAAAVAVSLELGEEGAACAEQVQSATAQCQSKMATAKKAADKVCNGRDYEAVMAKVAKLRKLAEQQEAAIRRSGAALTKARDKAASFAKQSSVERGKLLAELKKQKGAKGKLDKINAKAAAEDKDLDSMRRNADAAMKKAVDLARTSGSDSRVSAAKDKAHSLYRKMVDVKVQVATLHHEVSGAQKELDAISQVVAKEIQHAKKTAQTEANSLKEVAKDRTTVAAKKLQEAQYKLEEATTKEDDAVGKKNQMKAKANAAKADIATGEQTVKNAKTLQAQAAKSEKAAAKTKVDVGPLELSKLREEARKMAKAGTTPPAIDQSNMPAKNSVHNTFATQVKQLEKQRLQAKAAYHSAESKLATLTSSGASQEAVSRAQQDVNTAAANLKKLAAKQHGTVMKAVNAVKQGMP
jgi:hypothetical protein